MFAAVEFGKEKGIRETRSRFYDCLLLSPSCSLAFFNKVVSRV
jgi:hypothetical protein